MAQALADPYSGLTAGLTGGVGLRQQHEQLMLQKADSKMRQDINTLNSAITMMNIPGLPDEKKLEIYNSTVVPLSKKFDPSGGMTQMREWPNEANKLTKELQKLSGAYEKKSISPRDYLSSLGIIGAKAKSLGVTMDISGLQASAQKDIRRGLLERPGVPGLPEETADVGMGLTLTRPEVPGIAGGLTPEAQEMGAIGRETFIETGKREKPSAKTAGETSYIPTDDGKYQYMVVDKASGETKPVLRNGKPVILTEKQVLISEGKKAQSLINPYENKFMSELGKSEATRMTKLKETAQDSVASLSMIKEARNLINQGIYTGSAANIRKNLDKWLQETGVYIGGRKAANTEAYASMMGLQVGKIIKNFGSGTGLSDADREYAEKIVGGRVTLTQDAIERLLDINERLAKFNITEYNDQIERAKRATETKDYLQPIPIAEPTATPTVAPQGAGKFKIISVQ
jgi:hypothetical protein